MVIKNDRAVMCQPREGGFKLRKSKEEYSCNHSYLYLGVGGGEGRLVKKEDFLS